MSPVLHLLSGARAVYMASLHRGRDLKKASGRSVLRSVTNHVKQVKPGIIIMLWHHSFVSLIRPLLSNMACRNDLAATKLLAFPQN